jgi:5-methylcytosine-specific restriction endonuclease McrA
MLITSYDLRRTFIGGSPVNILSHHTPDSNPQKRCTKCRKLLPATAEFFQRNKTVKDGLRPDCKVCVKEFRNTLEKKAKTQVYNRAYYADADKRDRYLTQRKDNYRNDPEVRQQALDYNKRPDVREYQRSYLKEYNQRPEVKERDREARRIAKKNRRAHAKEISGSYTVKQIQDLLKRQKYKCYYCTCKFEQRDGKYVYHIEHTFPINRIAGTAIPANDISYLVLACPSCNHKKSDKFPWEFPEGGRLL